MRQMIFVVLSGIALVLAFFALFVTGAHGVLRGIDHHGWMNILSSEFPATMKTANLQIILSFAAVMCLVTSAGILWWRMRSFANPEIYFAYLFFVTAVSELVPQWLWGAVDREVVYSTIIFITRIYLFGSFFSVTALLLFGVYPPQVKTTTYRSFSLVVMIITGVFVTVIPIDITRIDGSIMDSVSEVFLLRIVYGVLLGFCVLTGIFNWRHRSTLVNLIYLFFMVNKAGLHLLLGSDSRLFFCGLFFLMGLGSIFLTALNAFPSKISLATKQG